MVHLHFSKPVRGATKDPVVSSATEISIGPSRGAVGEGVFQLGSTGRQISEDLTGRTAGSVVNLAAPLFRPARVLRHIFSSQRPGQAAEMDRPVRIAFQIHCHISVSPILRSPDTGQGPCTRQPAR